MTDRNYHSAAHEPGRTPAPYFEFEERETIDQAIDGIYAAAVKKTRPAAFLSALASLVAADAVLLESGPPSEKNILPNQAPRIIALELPNADTGLSIAVFMRDDRSRQFEPRHRALLARLAPHIARAVSIRSTLHQSAPNEPGKHIDQEALQRLFRLAPSHAKLLALLVGGDQIKSAAAKLGVTEGSARQYLKKIFEKTGVRRQMDLIRLADRALSQHDV